VHRPPIDATHLAVPGAVVALTGISHSERVGEAQLDALNKDLVLGNKVVFGTVNAARRHYDQAALAAADSGWLARLITGRLAVRNWPAALQKRPETSRSWST
jgi:glucose 1-dehydrogenase